MVKDQPPGLKAFQKGLAINVCIENFNFAHIAEKACSNGRSTAVPAVRQHKPCAVSNVSVVLPYSLPFSS